MPIPRPCILSRLVAPPSVASRPFLRLKPALNSVPYSLRTMSNLANKTILITGASAGIGKASAIEFARAAAPNPVKLVLTARRVNILEELKSEIEEQYKGTKVYPVKLDVRNSDEVRELLKRLPQEVQDIDILVNNAGLVKGMEKVGDIDEEDIQVMIDTNFIGLVAMTQAILPSMKSRNVGTIINIGSIAGRNPYSGGSIYSASKAAAQAFTESLRHELISTRIRVINIDPGQVETEFSIVRFRGDEEAAKKVYEGVIPLTGKDIAEIIVFTASRNENVVIADVLVFPNHQASATSMHRNPPK